MARTVTPLAVFLTLPLLLTGCGDVDGGKIEHPRELVAALEKSDTTFCTDTDKPEAEQQADLNESKSEDDGWDGPDEALEAELAEEGYATTYYGGCWILMWDRGSGAAEAKDLAEGNNSENYITGENWIVTAYEDPMVDAMHEELGGEVTYRS